jgi:hypothetical protein
LNGLWIDSIWLTLPNDHHHNPVSQLISNLTVADPHPTGEFDPLAPFHESLSLVDRGLVQSANMDASGSSSSMASPPLSTDQLNWVHRQLGPVNRLIEQHTTSRPL